MRKLLYLAAAAACLAAPMAHAAETIKYTYDAKGRLVKVEHSCPANASSCVNNGVVTQYEYDKADNRKKVTTTGAPS